MTMKSTTTKRDRDKGVRFTQFTASHVRTLHHWCQHKSTTSSTRCASTSPRDRRGNTGISNQQTACHVVCCVMLRRAVLQVMKPLSSVSHSLELLLCGLLLVTQCHLHHLSMTLHVGNRGNTFTCTCSALAYFVVQFFTAFAYAVSHFTMC